MIGMLVLKKHSKQKNKSHEQSVNVEV